MTQEQRFKAVDLIEKTIKYNGVEATVTDFKEVNQKMVIITDKRTFNFIGSAIDDFFDNVEIVTEKKEAFKPSHVETKKQDLAIYEPTPAQKKTQEALLDMLDKVKDNPEAIPQAKAVCDIANTMVNMEKAQIDLMKLAANR